VVISSITHEQLKTIYITERKGIYITTFYHCPGLVQNFWPIANELKQRTYVINYEFGTWKVQRQN
jgi:hypothetical protein